MAANDDRHDDDEAAGSVLGISRVAPGPVGDIERPRSERTRKDEEDEGQVMPLEDSEDLGARDVTKVGRGETGPETGGHGSTPQRSGATGSDVGG